jgi:copper chaperone CopZ
MRRLIFLCFILMVLSIPSFVITATDEATNQAEAAKSTLQDAVFAVPNLSDDLAKSLTLSLAEIAGIAATKPDLEAKKFTVTFDSTKTSKEKIEEAIKKIAPDSKLETVTATTSNPVKHDCGKCPSKKTCTKSEKS